MEKANGSSSVSGRPVQRRERVDSVSFVEDKPIVPIYTQLGVGIAMTLVKSVAYLYTGISWPIYFFLKSNKPLSDQNISAQAIPVRSYISNSETIQDYHSAWRATEDIDHPLKSTPFSSINNLSSLFIRAAKLWPDREILGKRQLLSVNFETQPNGKRFKKLAQGTYKWFTYTELEVRIANIVEALQWRFSAFPENICKPPERLLIFSETRLEWQLSAQACFRAGIPLVTLYATLGEDAVVHGILETEVQVIFTSDELLPTVARLLPRVPAVRYVVYFRDPEDDGVPGDDFQLPALPSQSTVELIHICHLEEWGAHHLLSNSQPAHQSELDESSLAVIMYTSGSSGPPKGVELTHGNLLAAVAGLSNRLSDLTSADCYIAYLPLAHIMELCSEVLLLALGIRMGYGAALSLVTGASKVQPGSRGDVAELRPTLMACVPAVLDRLYSAVWSRVTRAGPFFVQLFTWALEFRRSRQEAGFPSLVLDRLVFRGIRRILGGRVRLMLSGGSPLSVESQSFVNSVFCRTVQGYGLTETGAAGTVGHVHDMRGGHVGVPLSCCQLRLEAWTEGGYTPDDQPRPRGEILIGGPNVALGYFRQPELTNEAFFKDDDGVAWFRTGDIGLIHADGTLSIVDRKKDLVKLRHGEYVSLGKVELALVAGCPLVEQVCVYAQSGAVSCVALVVPRRAAVLDLVQRLLDAATTTTSTSTVGASEASNNNSSSASSSANQLLADLYQRAVHQSDELAYEQLLSHDRLRRAALRLLQSAARDQRLSSAEIPAGLWLDGRAWTPDNGLLTAALKLRRRRIQEAFQDRIDEIYQAL